MKVNKHPSKWSMLLSIYAVPILVAILFCFFKEVQLNGEETSKVARFFIGLLVGMSVEGLLLIIGGTFSLLLEKEDLDSKGSPQ